MLLCCSRCCQDWTTEMLYWLAYLVLWLRSVLNAAARVIFHLQSAHLITLHWLLISERIEHTIALLTFRVLHGSAPPYLGPIVPVRSLLGRWSLRFTGTNRLLVPSVKRSTVGSRAFLVAGPKTWDALPEDVTSSLSEYTFCHQLNTWFFKKSFPDIIIWYWLHPDLA